MVDVWKCDLFHQGVRINPKQTMSAMLLWIKAPTKRTQPEKWPVIVNHLLHRLCGFFTFNSVVAEYAVPIRVLSSRTNEQPTALLYSGGGGHSFQQVSGVARTKNIALNLFKKRSRKLGWRRTLKCRALSVSGTSYAARTKHKMFSDTVTQSISPHRILRVQFLQILIFYEVDGAWINDIRGQSHPTPQLFCHTLSKSKKTLTTHHPTLYRSFLTLFFFVTFFDCEKTILTTTTPPTLHTLHTSHPTVNIAHENKS